jgi:MoaA/NifB/PqqE/SkfB family radical SAM enzyme
MRSWGEFVARTWNENILYSVMLELTYRCDLACVYCYNDRSRTASPLLLAEYQRLLEDLAAMEVLHLVLTGGEPLRHPDFFAIGRTARRLGFAVRIKSNGHSLDREKAMRLRDEVDPWVVDLSIHGARAATHDRQTRVPGSFSRLLDNVEALRSLGVRVKLNCTLTRWNEGEIEELFALADRLGVPLAVNPTLSPRDDGDPSPLALAPSDEGVRRLMHMARARAGRTQGGEGTVVALAGDEGLPPAPPAKHCGAGSSTLTVDPFGTVYPCVQWRRPLGSIRERSIRDIWNGSQALRAIRETTVAAKNSLAGRIPEHHRGHFCPGLAEMLTGNPLALYPAAQRLLALAAESELPTDS